MTHHDLLVRGARLAWLPGAPVGDVAAAGGVVTEIGPEIGGDAAEVVDGEGLDLLPGGVDPHVHLNEPGRTEWEGIATGTAALAVGGATCAIDMPLNASPPVLDGASFDLKAAAIPGVARVDLALWGGLVPGDLDRLDELAGRGVIGFKAFMCNTGIGDFAQADDQTLFEGMQRAAKLDLPVAVHAENDTVTQELAPRISLEVGYNRRWWGNYTVTDNDGRFAFEALPSGTFALQATTPGYDTYVAPVQVAGGL